jgi:hypothetical protein
LRCKKGLKDPAFTVSARLVTNYWKLIPFLRPLGKVVFGCCVQGPLLFSILTVYPNGEEGGLGQVGEGRNNGNKLMFIVEKCHSVR